MHLVARLFRTVHLKSSPPPAILMSRNVQPLVPHKKQSSNNSNHLKENAQAEPFDNAEKKTNSKALSSLP